MSEFLRRAQTELRKR